MVCISTTFMSYIKPSNQDQTEYVWVPSSLSFHTDGYKQIDCDSNVLILLRDIVAEIVNTVTQHLPSFDLDKGYK